MCVVCVCGVQVRVGQVLKISGEITRIDGKKMFVSAKLIARTGAVHAAFDGVSIVPVNLSQKDDSVSKRVWLDGEGPGSPLRDSGWLLP